MLTHRFRGFRAFSQFFLPQAIAISLFAGCAQIQPASDPQNDALAGVRRAELSTATKTDSTPLAPRPPADALSAPIEWRELQPLLSEAAGRLILEEIALDRVLDRELVSRGLSVSESDTRDEAARLNDSIGETGASEDAAAILLEKIRASRGLGPARFKSLLARNAKLRSLVRGDVDVTQAEIANAVEVRYGPKVVCRIIVTDTEREAAEVRRPFDPRPLDQPPPFLRERFAAEAMKRSRDSSAPRGGLLSPFSLADNTYPAIMRKALESLAPGAVSSVIALDQGYAILLLEETIPAEAAPEDALQKMAASVRLRKERLAMDRLAKTLLARAGVSVADESLRWSWTRPQADAPR